MMVRSSGKNGYDFYGGMGSPGRQPSQPRGRMMMRSSGKIGYRIYQGHHRIETHMPQAAASHSKHDDIGTLSKAPDLKRKLNAEESESKGKSSLPTWCGKHWRYSDSSEEECRESEDPDVGDSMFSPLVKEKVFHAQTQENKGVAFVLCIT